MSIASSLPREIQFQILNHLDACTISHYSSVCRNWNKPAEWMLYQIVTLSHIDQLCKLISALSSNPRLGELVSSLTLKLHVPTHDMIYTLAQYTPNIKTVQTRQGNDVFDIITTACLTRSHWTQLRAIDIPDWRRKHDNYYNALLSLCYSLTEIHIIVPSDEALYAPGPNYLQFISKRSEFFNTNHLICHTSYPSRKRSTELKTLDDALSGFVSLKTIDFQLFELEDNHSYLDKVQPNRHIRRLKVNVQHMTSVLLDYLYRKFPCVTCFEFWHLSSYDCKPYCLSAPWIQKMIRYVQSMDHFTVVLHDATNQMEFVNSLTYHLAEGKSHIKLHYNNDPQWYSNHEASIQFERSVSRGGTKEISIDPSLLSKAFVDKISDYLMLASSLCIYNKSRKSNAMIYPFSEVVDRCSNLKSLSITYCSLNSSIAMQPLYSLTTLRLSRCMVSAEAIKSLSRTFVNLKHVAISHPVLLQPLQLIDMPFTSANTFVIEFDKLSTQKILVFQIVIPDQETHYELKHCGYEIISATTFESQEKNKEAIQFKIILKSVDKLSIRYLDYYCQ